MRKALFVAGLFSALTLSAAVPQTHIYRNDGKFFHKYEGDVTIIHSTRNSKNYIVIDDGMHTTEIPLQKINRIEVTDIDIPRLHINTPSRPNLKQVEDKENYLNANISIEGNGYADDLEQTSVMVKGRGNSTWWMAKRPMRLKFEKKTSIAGFKKAKSYVLLANYIDPTSMRNAIAMKMAQLLGIQWANHMVPVNVTFNGNDLGIFMLTEKVGINSASIDIDETRGILFELSNEYDEKYKFYSSVYNLPVMVKDPDLDEIAAANPALGTATEIFNKWKNDYNKAEDMLRYGNPAEAFDLDSFADFILLYDLCRNGETGHPKSFYIHKENLDAGTLYKAGPVWDFDVAFNIVMPYNDAMVPASATDPNWYNALLSTLFQNSKVKARYRAQLKRFADELLPQLLDYFDELEPLIRSSVKMNGLIWPGGDNYGWTMSINSFDHENNVAKLRTWILDRVNYLKKQYNIQ